MTKFEEKLIELIQDALEAGDDPAEIAGAMEIQMGVLAEIAAREEREK